MAGFWERLFNRGSDEYFLDQDSAKTLGNVEYMRKRSKIVRTFPKVGDAKAGAEIVKEISSLEERELAETEASKPAFEQNGFVPPKDNSPTPDSLTPKTSTNMDFFRKLAKDIRR